MPPTPRARRSSKLLRSLASFTCALAAFGPAVTSLAQEPAACLSSDPNQWPASSRPYFMVLVDTSGSMLLSVPGATPSCSGYPGTRMGHAKCAVRNTALAFGGEVNFGLAQFASFMTGCGSHCYGNDSGSPNPRCVVQCYTSEVNTTGECGACGPKDSPGAPASTRRGGRILVGMQQDVTWAAPTTTTNLPQLLQWVDNNCSSNLEVVNTPTDGDAYGKTPLNGSLRDMKRYFQTGWTNPDNAAETFPTPLTANDRACRSVNVILLTDGDETCDTHADAVAAAQDLFVNGVTVGGKNFKIRVHVVNFAGGSVANTDGIAAAGGTTKAQFATNEVELSKALANIIAGTIKPEICDNTDNNCNGCTDEGSLKYCNVQPAPGNCCAWGNEAQRQNCLTSYKNSITPQAPEGNLKLLPCTTPAQAQNPATWLCFDPKETCDDVDNNCQEGVDEGVLKCGNPLACPTAEICDGKDNDCDGLIDEGGVCPNSCSPSAEVCDGCDNDCNGIADNGVPSVPCGFESPPNCAGFITCKPSQPVSIGGCHAGGGYNACNNSPQTEICDGLDNDCNGIVDDNVPPTACVPDGAPQNLVYGPNSQCKMGQKPCNGTCQGWVGPSTEVCDGIDNDCDGIVDNGAFGVGLPCGVNQPPCSPGLTACVGGAMICQGGTPPQAEICDGIDNNCNGAIDEAPLADAPAAAESGCWNLPGLCCTFGGHSWCPPAGATCHGKGTLTAPCTQGNLSCVGGSWTCSNSNGPTPEVCDGVDNNCNGMVDEGNLPLVGEPCGTDVGECEWGVLDCNVGVLSCNGGVNPKPELCDGLDNDCDGDIDNGIPVGGPCVAPYDAALYPGDRSKLPCQPGTLQCDGNGNQVCVGGVGPSPEVCDGLDNDCDGQTDEVGAAPDGINGTENPYPPPAGSIGDACGSSVGACSPGSYACVNGLFACQGGDPPVPEECDCDDNDCDGLVDNQKEGAPPICSPGKDCVSTGSVCQCAAKCGAGEYPCPAGQKCEPVTKSGTGESLGFYCVVDQDALCGDCSTKTVKDANGVVLCAPSGTVLANCVEPPVCVCQGQSGCQPPCFGVTCGAGFVCADHGPKAGKCLPSSCYSLPCAGCDKACHLGTCVTNPCDADSCPAAEACKPSADFESHTCVPSCADVTCGPGTACQDGVCAPTCDPPCGAGLFCDTAQSPPACVADQCLADPCTDGSCCDPVTGACGDCPCEGVVCPEGQHCSEGDCFSKGEGTGGGSSAASGGGGASAGSSTGSGSTSAGGGTDERVWGLATGGGGCACEVFPRRAAPGKNLGGLALALGALAAARWRRRRRPRVVVAGEVGR